ncbi:hypothetical protein DEO23_06950 [Brachybacterium endophyticum]|uniref:DUF4235 domain-containing protein n=1 Tax=Brachybacterium endophyticum TaxID=2182385 RepID=A0A2U2RLB9_9MICO|nr:DUF4235 domain-containing protein [Brachybacterium endophyticum]PWH06669.1 hypothetical protein DEO23_06950 [Brachybacterium endophyticum]
MPNPLVKIAMTGASIAAGVVGQKVITAIWNSVLDEDAPTNKNIKRSAKETKAARKEAKKSGASKAEVKAITDPENERPAWQIIVWTLLTGVVLQAFRQAARNGTEVGARKITERRPRPNRG